MQPFDTKDQTPDEIAATLERDREQLAGSIDGLRNRLSIDTLIGDAFGFAKANMAPQVHALDRAVRSNPLAAVMAGVGLAWLVFGRRAGASSGDTPLAGTKFEALSRWEDEGGPASPTTDTDAAWMTQADALRDQALSSLARIDAAARQKLRPVADLARDRARVLADLATSTRVAMLRGLDSLTSDARDQKFALREKAYASRLAAVRQGTKLIEERPFVAGAIGMAIGAAVASALPRTATEDRLFGQERNRLMSRAREALLHNPARGDDSSDRPVGNPSLQAANIAPPMVTTAI